MTNIKQQFPIFKNNPNLIYFDNAATTQKPKRVIDSITKFYESYNANVHRGLYPISEQATEAYENARKTVAKFINASSEEIIFVSGATEAFNAVAKMLGESEFIKQNPRIVTTDFEHNSSILPFRFLEPEVIQYLGINENYNLADSKFMDNADLFISTMASNATGTRLPIESLIKENDYPYSIIDATQAVAHEQIDVKKINCDFLTFSAHKLFGPMGIGVLYVKKEILEHLEPFKFGGGMVTKVDREENEWKSSIEKFEAGTPNVAGAIALTESINFIEDIGFDEIEKYERKLRKVLFDKLNRVKDIQIFHHNTDKSLPVLSFAHNKVHAHDIAQALGDENTCVRAGHHCTQILHKQVLEVPSTVRVSLSFYNNIDEIDKFVETLDKVIKKFI